VDYFLAGLPAFKRLPEGSLERLSQALHLRRYLKGQTVFTDKDAPESVYLLKSGLVKAVKYSPREDPVIMELIAPGGFFGMIAVLERKPYPVTAVCIHDSEAYRISVADFEDLMKRHPEFAREVYQEIGRHLRHGQTLRSLSKEPAEKRIAYILWMLSAVIGKELPILREDVAEMAGTSAETAVRCMIELRRKKLISSRWKRITILDAQGLKDLSG
jgi:CRP-like cAMP-binding protein